jgi:3-hydroxyisobutyrate dehydrogenase-like beta-hydroxyacid dehydrogenase
MAPDASAASNPQQTIADFGWLGTGRMGTAMAGLLIAAGHRVAVWNRTPSKTAALVERGAIAVGSLAELARCPVVFSTVSGSADLTEVILGPDGLFAGEVGPRVLIDCSTVSSEVSARIRAAAEQRGAAFLAAPVSGNAHVVAAGQACLMVSGSSDIFHELQPVLRQIAATTVFVGESEQSRLVKLCLNLYLGMTVQALVEVLTLAEKGGTGREAFLDLLNATMLTSEWVRRRTPALTALDWTPTFTTELLRKDFDLGLGEARALEVPMPAASAVHQLIQVAIGHGLRQDDFLSVYEAQAAAAGLRPLRTGQPPDDQHVEAPGA